MRRRRSFIAAPQRVQRLTSMAKLRFISSCHGRQRERCVGGRAPAAGSAPGSVGGASSGGDGTTRARQRLAGARTPA
jgi:hypothetical protein